MRRLLTELRRRDQILFATGGLIAIALVGSLVGLLVDTRLILGINPWIKPIKFEISIVVFLWTLAWYMADVRAGVRTRALIRLIPCLVMGGEIALIVLQSARGVTSHFNESSALNGAIFSAMGMMITVNTVAVVLMLAKLRRDTPAERAGYLWGLRLGLGVFALASLQGFVIVANHAHTVPAPDGGAGLPFVNWSTEHGDLRIAHFFGLHALQAMPLLGYAIDTWWSTSPGARVRVVAIASVAWLAVMAGLLALALGGRPLLAI